jgi:Holliday junction resolvase RusA-like endonuclease
MIIELKVDIKPRAYQSVRYTGKDKGIFYKPKWVKEYQSAIWKQVEKQTKGFTFPGPVRILKLIYFHKTLNKKLWGKYKETKPDLMDNLHKPFFDSISGKDKGTGRLKLIKDDSLIVEVNGLIRKVWSQHPGILCQIEGIE